MKQQAIAKRIRRRAQRLNITARCRRLPHGRRWWFYNADGKMLSNDEGLSDPDALNWIKVDDGDMEMCEICTVDNEQLAAAYNFARKLTQTDPDPEELADIFATEFNQAALFLSAATYAAVTHQEKAKIHSTVQEVWKCLTGLTAYIDNQPDAPENVSGALHLLK